MTQDSETTPQTPFRSRQIVCWEAGDRCLYAEVIQNIPERATCWVRPLLLATAAGTAPAAECWDLRTAPDLVWSARAFRTALDVEAIPLLASLAPALDAADETVARQQLNQFLRQAWPSRTRAERDRASESSD